MAKIQGSRTEFVYEEDGEDWIVIRESLYRTADGRIVPEDDKDARWLYGGPGMRVKREEAELLGIVSPKTRKPGGTKPKSPNGKK